ncbi:hypothetical protein BS47DRAFT_1365945 [Hydnum rufescens UP504]|uniref:Uncharacterized protein n=1 Tax=Hydnum rufescens UP504 TaxID=1448309 RepID=A0A9P6AMB7_9AGAM|nr:hypothetical protein BS47DRAFT_1365945 [Hydnum rufescens UP504]
MASLISYQLYVAWLSLAIMAQQLMVTVPGFNEFYATETKVICCKLAGEIAAAQFHPVLVLLYPNATGIHRYRVAELRLVFRTRLDRNNPESEHPFYAHVLWYTKIPSTPIRDVKLYRVDKDISILEHVGVA